MKNDYAVALVITWIILAVLGFVAMLQASDINSMKKHISCLEVGASYQRADDVESCEPITELGP